MSLWVKFFVLKGCRRQGYQDTKTPETEIPGKCAGEVELVVALPILASVHAKRSNRVGL